VVEGARITDAGVRLPNSHVTHLASTTAIPADHAVEPGPSAVLGISEKGSPSRRPRPRAPTGRRSSNGVAIVIITLVLLAANVAGASYYRLPIGQRVRSPLHPLLKSSGTVGQTAGIVALAIFVFLWLYPLRKRWRALAFTGAVGRWMDVHIVAALALPLLLTIHAAWKFGGVIGLGFWAMMIVCASGIVGRYLYVRIPRSRSGAELSLEEVAGQRRALTQQIVDATGLHVDDVRAMLNVKPTGNEPGSVIRSVSRLVASDLTRWRTRREIRRRWRAYARRSAAVEARTINEVAELAVRETELAERVALLHLTQRVFRWWHVAHRPIALTALIAVFIHVAVVVAVGATWFW
jgi:hypothetical protein